MQGTTERSADRARGYRRGGTCGVCSVSVAHPTAKRGYPKTRSVSPVYSTKIRSVSPVYPTNLGQLTQYILQILDQLAQCILQKEGQFAQ